jgi:hypothetical protein
MDNFGGRLMEYGAQMGDFEFALQEFEGGASGRSNHPPFVLSKADETALASELLVVSNE